MPLVAPAAYFDAHPADEMRRVPRVAGDRDDIPAAGVSKNSESTGLAGEPEKEKRVLSGYYASVSFMDAQVGRVLAELDALGLREKTVVVFTSDHGYHLGEHDFWQKMSLHEESVRVPLLIDAPGKAAGVTAALAEAIDLYPTLCELAGLEVPGHCRGVSLVPVLDDHGAAVRDEVYCFRGNAHLLRTGRWAYLQYGRGGEELYDMAADPKQYVNLAGREEGEVVLAEMRGRLEAKLAGMGAGRGVDE